MMENNPARLLRALLSAGDQAAETNGGRPNITCLDVWRNVFAPDDVLVAQHVNRLYRLPGEIRRAFRSAGRNVGHLGPKLANLDAVGFTQGVGVSWAQYWAAIDGDDLLGLLDFGATILDPTVDRTTPRIDNPDGLRTHLEGLLDDVIESEELSEEVKQLVIPYLVQMIAALLGLETRTSTRFWRVYEAFFAIVDRSATLARDLMDTKAGAAVATVVVTAVLMRTGIAPKTLGGGEAPKPDPVVVMCIDPSRTPPALPPGAPASPKKIGPTNEAPPGAEPERPR